MQLSLRNQNIIYNNEILSCYSNFKNKLNFKLNLKLNSKLNFKLNFNFIQELNLLMGFTKYRRLVGAWGHKGSMEGILGGLGRFFYAFWMYFLGYQQTTLFLGKPVKT